MNIKYFMFLAVAILFAQCKAKEDSNISATTDTTNMAGIIRPVDDTTKVIPTPERTLATPTKGERFCYNGGGASLNTMDDGNAVQGTFSYKSQYNGKFLGSFANDTIKGIILNELSGKTGPFEAWFVKKGETFEYMSTSHKKDDKGANYFENANAVKAITTLSKGSCK